MINYSINIKIGLVKNAIKLFNSYLIIIFRFMLYPIFLNYCSTVLVIQINLASDFILFPYFILLTLYQY